MIKGWFNPQVAPEQLLLKYCQTQDNDYLELLVKQFNRALYHYLITLSDAELAQDVLQSTWLKVMKAANKNSMEETVTGAMSVKNWLFAIARNTLIDELRRQQRWQWQPINDSQIVSQTLAEQVAKKDRLSQLNWALGQLPFSQKEAIVLQQEGFSLFDIAQFTGEGTETIKSRLRYAKNNLKNILGATNE